jgi:hypothetical protein
VQATRSRVRWHRGHLHVRRPLPDPPEPARLRRHRRRRACHHRRGLVRRRGPPASRLRREPSVLPPSPSWHEAGRPPRVPVEGRPADRPDRPSAQPRSRQLVLRSRPPPRHNRAGSTSPANRGPRSRSSKPMRRSPMWRCASTVRLRKPTCCGGPIATRCRGRIHPCRPGRCSAPRWSDDRRPDGARGGGIAAPAEGASRFELSAALTI